MELIRLAIFVSGNGSNCENIIRFFQKRTGVEVSVVVSSRADAFALVRAKGLGVRTFVVSRSQLNEDRDLVLGVVRDCDFIILAGFLLKVPDFLIEEFDGRIINIHPSLLPKFGGAGMWGHHVHEAVRAAGERQTGITIHFVNSELDGGKFIAQFACEVSPSDSAEDIAQRVSKLEMEHFPKVIEEVVCRMGPLKRRA